MTPRLWLSLAGCVLALSACSGEQAESDPVTTATTGTVESTLDCTALISDDVVTALGWAVGDGAAEDAGRCLRRVDESGAITVSTRAQTDGDAAATLQAECERLRATGAYVAQPVDWLEPTRDQSCASGLDVSTGVAELLFVNDTDEVVQVRVEALQAVTPEQLEAAMGAVAAAAGTDVEG